MDVLENGTTIGFVRNGVMCYGVIIGNNGNEENLNYYIRFGGSGVEGEDDVSYDDDDFYDTMVHYNSIIDVIYKVNV
jgi:hypothetical protein